jgi:hypothetical protein
MLPSVTPTQGQLLALIGTALIGTALMGIGSANICL